MNSKMKGVHILLILSNERISILIISILKFKAELSKSAGRTDCAEKVHISKFICFCYRLIWFFLPNYQPDS